MVSRGRMGTGRHRAPRGAGRAGFSLPELLVTCSIIAIMAGLTVPWIATASRAYKISRGAREIQAALNQARSLAITTRQNICFQSVSGGYRYRQGTCGGTAWVGLDTSSNGTFTPSSGATLSGGSPIFTPFGTASTTAVITVSASGKSTTVTVLPSGRVTIP
jgi:prepilin-type N-terminal cleavage/methylation domain-containing protein